MTPTPPPPSEGTSPRPADGPGLTAVVAGALSLGLGYFLLPTAAGLATTFVCFAGGTALVIVTARRAGVAARFGAANRITAYRGAVIALIAGAAVDAAGSTFQNWWALTAIAAVALLLDGVDGAIARRDGTATAFGARFDMEVDAAFILALTLLLASSGKVGPWIVLIGTLRYAYVAAGAVLPALRRPLGPSTRRRLVCALQGVALIICLAPATPAPVAVPIAAAALAVLLYSFATDVRAQLRGSD